jgi:hypothetical protein
MIGASSRSASGGFPSEPRFRLAACRARIAGGTSTVEWVSIFFAFAAFIVSAASLWFASLPRPNVNVHRIAASAALQVERFDVVDFAEANDRPAIWSALGALLWA